MPCHSIRDGGSHTIHASPPLRLVPGQLLGHLAIGWVGGEANWGAILRQHCRTKAKRPSQQHNHQGELEMGNSEPMIHIVGDPSLGTSWVWEVSIKPHRLFLAFWKCTGGTFPQGPAASVYSTPCSLPWPTRCQPGSDALPGHRNNWFSVEPREYELHKECSQAGLTVCRLWLQGHFFN